jgi:GNAT superfamily N-acetyltransferase
MTLTAPERLATEIDVAPLAQAIRDNPMLWAQNVLRQSYEGSAHSATQAIILRGPTYVSVEKIFNTLEAVDYPAIGALVPAINELMIKALEIISAGNYDPYGQVEGVEELGRVMLVELEPGGKIEPHVDEGIYADHFQRFHLVVESDGTSWATHEGAAVHYTSMNEGELWAVPHKMKHSFENNTSKPRIHMIIDAVSKRFHKQPKPRYSGKYELKEVSFADIMSSMDANQMFADHWDEIALNKKLMVLKPFVEGYKVLEKADKLMIIGAFLGDQMVGYSANFLVQHMHYADLDVCQNDLLFVDKEHRKGRLGLGLIKETERLAAERGARLMMWHVKENTPLNILMQKKGYGVQDIIYSKEL